MNDISHVIEDIKWFMFHDGTAETTNSNGFSHGLVFNGWTGNGNSFTVKDKDGNIYRVSLEKEE